MEDNMYNDVIFKEKTPQLNHDNSIKELTTKKIKPLVVCHHQRHRPQDDN